MRNRNGFRQNMGPGGNCVCANCGHEMSHSRGVPCFQQACPQCGGQMSRKMISETLVDIASIINEKK